MYRSGASGWPSAPSFSQGEPAIARSGVAGLSNASQEYLEGSRSLYIHSRRQKAGPPTKGSAAAAKAFTSAWLAERAKNEQNSPTTDNRMIVAAATSPRAGSASNMPRSEKAIAAAAGTVSSASRMKLVRMAIQALPHKIEKGRNGVAAIDSKVRWSNSRAIAGAESASAAMAAAPMATRAQSAGCARARMCQTAEAAEAARASAAKLRIQAPPPSDSQRNSRTSTGFCQSRIGPGSRNGTKMRVSGLGRASSSSLSSKCPWSKIGARPEG
ncbi:MAG: hypothetical protein BWZ10_03082 [candidate division BRC1 bacterium ADurb.BinA364]|nr:MAG: hypothetical protein BWZ10_03082 [candidate division BRC1 bacterium ADurb.BinA364]